MEIARDGYLQKLIGARHNGLIKIITGLRRVGKSYLLFTIFKNYLLVQGVAEDHIIEISFESIENEHLREPHAVYDHVLKMAKDKEQYYVLLDEIQYVDRFTEVLNGFLHHKNLDVYVTGSNSRMLSKDVLTEFRGRGDEIRVYPLSFGEFYAARQGDVYEALDEYFLYGGLPRILQLATDEEKINYLKNFFSETYYRDLLERHKVAHIDDFNDLINILASGVGSLTNPNKLEKTFASVKKSTITAKTIKNYLEYLDDAFLLSKALRYDVKGKRYINTPLKYYFTDVGLRNARLGFRQVENNHLMENIIYNELCYRGFQVDIGMVELREKDVAGKFQKIQLEIDFIATKGNKKYYFQSVYMMPDITKEKQETRPMLKVKDTFQKFLIVYNHQKPGVSDDGVITLSLKDFLLSSNFDI